MGNIILIIFIAALGLFAYTHLDVAAEKIRDFLHGRKVIKLDKTIKHESPLKALTSSNESLGGISVGIKKPKSILNMSTILESPFNDEGHILAVGGSGLGKTSALLIPTLRSWDKSDGTFICWDISGDINPKVISEYTLNFEPLNKNSIPYDIFRPIDSRRTDDEKIEELRKLAFLLMPDNPEASEAGKYYNDTGREILLATLIHYYFKGEEFVTICKKILNTDWKNLLNTIDVGENQAAIGYINGLEGIPENYIASAKQTCTQAITLFATTPALEHTLRRAKNEEYFVSPEKLECNNVFIIIDDSELEVLAPLNQIIASQILDYIAKRPLENKRPILLCMDEAASLGAINILPGLRKFRKRHCRIFMLTQSISDIDLTWGEKQRKSMMTNFKYKIVLECSEPDEQSYWSKLAGTSWIWHDSSVTKNNGFITQKNESLTKENNIEPADFANLGDDLILFYPGGYERLEKNYYFKQKEK